VIGTLRRSLKHEAAEQGRALAGRPDPLSETGTGRDGEWIRITQHGYFVAEVRAVEELARYVDPAELEVALPPQQQRRTGRGCHRHSHCGPPNRL
jgi:hypothetical protein